MKNALRRNAIPTAEWVLIPLYLGLLFASLYLVRDPAYLLVRSVVANLWTLGWLSSAVLLGLLLLQAVRLRQMHRRAAPFESPNLLVQLFVLTHAVDWSMVAFMKRDLWFTVPNFVLVPFALVTGLLVVRARMRHREVNAAGAAGSVREREPQLVNG